MGHGIMDLPVTLAGKLMTYFDVFTKGLLGKLWQRPQRARRWRGSEKIEAYFR